MGKQLVSIVMGSANDWEIMQQAARQLQDFGVSYDARVISAHRSPDLLFDYIKEISAQGVQCFIAGASLRADTAYLVPLLRKICSDKYTDTIPALLHLPLRG